MTCLPDVNVWIALAVAEHVHHEEAKNWFESAADDRIAFCRITQMGFLRLLTNPHILGEDVVTPGRAWVLYDALCRDARLIYVDEPPGFEALWRKATEGRTRGTNFWTDAYLTAFASAASCTLVTFDKGLARRAGSPLRLLCG